MACALSGGAFWSIALYGGSWAVRVASVMGIDSALCRKAGRLAPSAAAWLLPVRDILSVVEIGASYWIEDVTWRGHKMKANGIAANPVVPQMGS